MIFQNRKQAGYKLSKKLQKYADAEDVVILGIAHGGMEVASSISEKLGVPVDFVPVQRLQAPNNPELALGAVSNCGDELLNEHLISLLDVSKEYLAKERERQIEKARQLSQMNPSIALEGKTVILVCDGIATGVSIRVALAVVNKKNPKKVVLAVPVASSKGMEQIFEQLDEIICLTKPTLFQSVGAYYQDFDSIGY